MQSPRPPHNHRFQSLSSPRPLVLSSLLHPHCAHAVTSPHNSPPPLSPLSSARKMVREVIDLFGPERCMYRCPPPTSPPNASVMASPHLPQKMRHPPAIPLTRSSCLSLSPCPCMWATNWPVDAATFPPVEMLSFFDEMSRDLSSSARASLWAGSAARAYRL